MHSRARAGLPRSNRERSRSSAVLLRWQRRRRTDYLRRFDRNAVRAAGKAPWVIRLALWHWGRAQRRDAERFFEKSLVDMCAADQEVLSEPALRSRMIANSVELYRQGGRGMYDEALVLARPWGFDLSELRVRVELWQGGRDKTVPVAMSDHLAELDPRRASAPVPERGSSPAVPPLAGHPRLARAPGARARVRARGVDHGRKPGLDRAGPNGPARIRYPWHCPARAVRADTQSRRERSRPRPAQE